MAPAARKKSSAKPKSAKVSKRHRFDPIPKRVTTNFRVPFNRDEWAKLVEAWYSADVHGYPNKETIVGLAATFDRCIKQVNTFYTNRRQDVSHQEQQLGRKLTKGELNELLWNKHRGTVEERRLAKQMGVSVRAVSVPSIKSPSPAPSLTRSEGSNTETTVSEVSVESASSSVSVASSSDSEWSATVTPAMAQLLIVVNERLAELEVGKTKLTH